MVFPAQPSHGDKEDQFLIQDAFGLRRKIIPLLEANVASGLLNGLGTAFRFDPYGAFLTAHHIFSHRMSVADDNLQSRGAVIGVLSPGLIFGRPPIPQECFVRIVDATTFVGSSDDPMASLQGRKQEVKNLLDCMIIVFDDTNDRLHRDQSFLPLRLRGKPLQVGQRVMAVGFPELSTVRDETADGILVFTERMFGAVGEVMELLPHGRSLSRPWPVVRVKAHWRGGMSGGLVFNESGEVIGIVSAATEYGQDDREGYAFWFEPFLNLERWMSTIDPLNPGWFRCWAVVRPSPWHLAAVCLEREVAEEQCRLLGRDYEIRFGSSQFGSDNFISINRVG